MLQRVKAYSVRQLSHNLTRRRSDLDIGYAGGGVAGCCRVLQGVAGCCRVLQGVAGCCSVLQCIEVCCNVRQCLAVYCSVLQCSSLLHNETVTQSDMQRI